MAQEDLPYDFPSGYPHELRGKLISAALYTDNKTLSEINNDMYGVLVTRVYDEINAKVAKVISDSKDYPHSREILEMLLRRLQKFTEGAGIPAYKVGFITKIEYHLELAYKIERIDWTNTEIKAFSPVDELLIYMNYNSKSYIKLLEDWVAERIKASENPMEQLQTLHYYRKAFSQLHRKPDIALHDDYLSLSEVFENWFIHETEYLENELDLWVRTFELPKGAKKIADVEERIKWSLSSDQVALIVRAADDTRMIIAKSMNNVFQTVIPHFSTEHKEVLSASAVRARSYIAEQSDKEAVIKALEKMIKRINEY